MWTSILRIADCCDQPLGPCPCHAATGFFLGRNGKPSPLKVVAKGYGRFIIDHSELNGAQNARGAFEHGARAAREAVALT
ncbi:MAG: hypothetical protein JWO33_932 [Caulobacteraceae bacterium]|nr:hypothetical protein [Caulobacteraceae bacterium]